MAQFLGLITLLSVLIAGISAFTKVRAQSELVIDLHLRSPTPRSGEMIEAFGSFNDDTRAAPWTVTVDYGDGSAPESVKLLNHQLEVEWADAKIATLVPQGGGLPNAHWTYYTLYHLIAAEATTRLSFSDGGSVLDKLGFLLDDVSVVAEDNPPYNLVTNGSFEEPIVDTGQWLWLNSIPGWSWEFGPYFEVHRRWSDWTPAEGDQVVEIDFENSRDLYQDLSTLSGQAYTLRFALSPHPAARISSFNLSHRYATSGTYNIIVMVRNNHGSEGQAQLSITVEDNTPVGNGISVSPIDGIILTFDNVFSSGTTAVVTSNTGPALPSGFQPVNPPVFYDITTTAKYVGPVELCITYPVQVNDPNTMHLLQYEGNAWIDITSSNDTSANRICGQARSLSSFVISSGWIQEPPLGNSGVLVWSDEFDDSSLDTSKWTAIDNGWDPANNSWMSPDNVRIRNGKLVLISDMETDSNPAGRPYTSAGIFTGLNYSFRYGRIEIRAKVPTGKGMWPALWLLPPDPNMFIIGTPAGAYGMWPLSGEVDILETLGTSPHDVLMNLHYGNPHITNPSSYTLPDNGVVSDWHTYALDWQPHILRWYVDDILVKTESYWFTSAPGAAFPAPLDQPMSIIITVVVGGEWQGEPNDETVFPNHMLIDWVRVYQ
jgi:beta-glucanase (GH16 family)